MGFLNSVNILCPNTRLIPYQQNLEGFRDDGLQSISSAASCQAKFRGSNMLELYNLEDA